MKLKEKDLKNIKIIAGGGLKKYRFLSESFFFLFSLSLFGIGFGSFNIGNNSTNFDISVSTGNIEKILSAKLLSCFDLCIDGFIYDSGMISSEGHIQYQISINKEYAASIANNNKISLNFYLEDNSKIILNSNNLTYISYSVIACNTESEVTSIDNNTIFSALSDIDITVYENFLLDFKFNIVDLNYFKTDIYTQLIENSISPNFILKITGGN